MATTSAPERGTSSQELWHSARTWSGQHTAATPMPWTHAIIQLALRSRTASLHTRRPALLWWGSMRRPRPMSTISSRSWLGGRRVLSGVCSERVVRRRRAPSLWLPSAGVQGSLLRARWHVTVSVAHTLGGGFPAHGTPVGGQAPAAGGRRHRPDWGLRLPCLPGLPRRCPTRWGLLGERRGLERRGVEARLGLGWGDGFRVWGLDGLVEGDAWDG